MAWELEISTIDVAQGESSLVIARDNGGPGGARVMVIDGGRPSWGPVVHRYVRTRLNALGLAQVDHPSPCNASVKFDPAHPNQVLVDAIAGLKIVNTTTLSLSTDGGGGILNIPFVTANANATRFACDYWIETIEASAPNDGGSPEQVQQMQYSQQTNIEFLPQIGNPDKLIMWPHVNVNTLRKQ